VPQSLARILFHIVFSTKDRETYLFDSIRDELHRYLGGAARHHDGALLKAGSIEDHIHLLVAAPRTMAPADLVRKLKASSSKWLEAQDPRLRGFAWQAGYGNFSVSPSHRRAVEAYLDRQREHHREVSFQDEYRRLLKRNGIAWDERYVWE